MLINIRKCINNEIQHSESLSVMVTMDRQISLSYYTYVVAIFIVSISHIRWSSFRSNAVIQMSRELGNLQYSLLSYPTGKKSEGAETIALAQLHQSMIDLDNNRVATRVNHVDMNVEFESFEQRLKDIATLSSAQFGDVKRDLESVKQTYLSMVDKTSFSAACKVLLDKIHRALQCAILPLAVLSQSTFNSWTYIPNVFFVPPEFFSPDAGDYRMLLGADDGDDGRTRRLCFEAMLSSGKLNNLLRPSALVECMQPFNLTANVAHESSHARYMYYVFESMSSGYESSIVLCLSKSDDTVHDEQPQLNVRDDQHQQCHTQISVSYNEKLPKMLRLLYKNHQYMNESIRKTVYVMTQLLYNV